MDDRGRLDLPLMRSEDAGNPAAVAGARSRRDANARGPLGAVGRGLRRIGWVVRVSVIGICGLDVPRHFGLVAAVMFLGASIAYGAVKGDHLPMIVDTLAEVRDAMANTAGFRITTVAVSGERHLASADILATAGVRADASLLFLDADAARLRLKAVPWIAEAAVRKLYPDRVEIAITEREPFALSQVAGHVSVISREGTVIAPLSGPEFASLPLVVGPGSGPRAGEFITLLARYPDIRDQVRAAILVAERRWNLRLRDGIDIMLPESGVDAALALLSRLDHDKKLLSRDITAVDLRLPDRVSVRLSDEAAQARERVRQDKEKAAKRKGGDA
jgi:cell division protein FtsQ